MPRAILDALQYYGAGAATLAALIVSLNVGRRWTGIAMAIFVTSSLALIAWGFLDEDSKGIGWQNVVLLVINAVGVWRYLIVGTDGAAKAPGSAALAGRSRADRSPPAGASRGPAAAGAASSRRGR